ncbi:MAG: hypothetical protein NXI24_24890 [bacterium]|nr:hypothetical protein [bacterium]
MPEVLNPDIQIALQAAVAFLADTVTAGEGEISIPLSGAYLNGFVFSCGRARLIRPTDDPRPQRPAAETLEIALLGAHREAAWRHSWSATAVLLPEDQSAGSPDLLRRLNGGLQELLTDTVTTRFAHRWDPDWLERLSGQGQDIGITRGFLEVVGDDSPAPEPPPNAGPEGPGTESTGARMPAPAASIDDAELDGHLFRRVAGHWVWIGRAE